MSFEERDVVIDKTRIAGVPSVQGSREVNMGQNTLRLKERLYLLERSFSQEHREP